MNAQKVEFNKIQNILIPLFGQACCRQRVGKPRSLFFGLGEKLYHGNAKLADPYYGEWEIGTYYSGWRVIRQDTILCGSSDSVDSLSELDRTLKAIAFGRVMKLTQLTAFDVGVEFDSGVSVHFLATTSDNDDEVFGVINSQQNIAVQFTVDSGWTVGKANDPWQIS